MVHIYWIQVIRHMSAWPAPCLYAHAAVLPILFCFLFHLADCSQDFSLFAHIDFPRSAFCCFCVVSGISFCFVCLFVWSTFTYYVREYTWATAHMRRSEDIAQEWVLIELRCSGLAANNLTCWPVSLAQISFCAFWGALLQVKWTVRGKSRASISSFQGR